MFIGLDCCGDSNSFSATSVNLGDITNVQIQNGIYDTLFGSDNPDFTQDETNLYWDFDTRFYAKFQNSLVAGNVDYAASMVSSIRIKRRKNQEHNWFTVYNIPIETNDDFYFEYFDRYAQGSQDYYYALVPVIEKVEGNINKNSITSQFDSYFILDKDVSYPIIFNTKLSTQINRTTGVINTIGKKYPFVISNSISQYKTGTLEFALAQIIDCEINVKAGYTYRTQFEEWLTNGNPKIIKDWTGQIFMINITNSVPVDCTYYQLPSYSIEFTEIGDVLNNDDLYNNGFSNVNFSLSSSYD